MVDIAVRVSTVTKTTLLNDDYIFYVDPDAAAASREGGITYANLLAQLNGAISAGGISDGDKGDITVSGSGATWALNADAVGAAEINGGEAAAIRTKLGQEERSVAQMQSDLSVPTAAQVFAGRLNLTGERGRIDISGGSGSMSLGRPGFAGSISALGFRRALGTTPDVSIRLQIDGVDVTGADDAQVTDTEETSAVAATANNTFTADQEVTIVWTNNSGAPTYLEAIWALTENYTLATA